MRKMKNNIVQMVSEVQTNI